MGWIWINLLIINQKRLTFSPFWTLLRIPLARVKITCRKVTVQFLHLWRYEKETKCFIKSSLRKVATQLNSLNLVLYIHAHRHTRTHTHIYISKLCNLKTYIKYIYLSFLIRGVDKISKGTIFQKESTVAAVKISKVSVSPLHNFFFCFKCHLFQCVI